MPTDPAFTISSGSEVLIDANVRAWEGYLEPIAAGSRFPASLHWPWSLGPPGPIFGISTRRWM